MTEYKLTIDYSHQDQAGDEVILGRLLPVTDEADRAIQGIFDSYDPKSWSGYEPGKYLTDDGEITVSFQEIGVRELAEIYSIEDSATHSIDTLLSGISLKLKR